jgi:CubicO group peptidase (beta-lactamase class C family)
MLWMHQGNWKGDQIVDTAYVNASIQAVNLPDLDQPNENVDYYGYQWWMMKHKGNDVYYMRGIHGQFVLCYPEEDVVIVRLGHQRGEKIDHCFPEVNHMLDFAVKQF